MQQPDDMEYLEISLEKAKDKVSKMDSLLELTKNKHFKAIVEDGYFVDEASNLVLLLGSPNFEEGTTRVRVERSIQAIGCFRQYLSGIMQMGQEAQKSVVEHEKMREELLTEEGV